MLPDRVFIFALQRTLGILPSRGTRKKRLAYMKAQAVVIGVEQPRRHVVAFAVIDRHGDRIKYIEPQQFDFIPRLFAGFATSGDDMCRTLGFA